MVTLRRDQRGATAALFGVSALVVVGMVGLGTEGGSWYSTRRDAQNAADPAAHAGAVRLSMAQGALGRSLAEARVQANDTARDVATRNGFTNAANATVVTVNSPPSRGPNTANVTAVEVIIQRTRPRLATTLFLAADPVIETRGVAALQPNGSACLLGLPGPTGGVTGQLLASGSSSASASGCVLATNSTRGDAVSIQGSASIEATSIDMAT